MAVGGLGDRGDGSREVSGSVIGAIVRYVRSAGGDRGVASALSLCHQPRTATELEDPNTWISQEEAVSLFEAAGAVVGDPQIALHVGEFLIRQHRGTDSGERLRSLGSPSELMRNLAMAASSFTSISSLVPVELARDHAVLRSSAPEGTRRHVSLCDLTRGMLAEVPTLFGMTAIVVDESECQARGGRACEYRVSWCDEAAPPRPSSYGDHGTEHRTAAERTTAELTAAELTAAKDAESERTTAEDELRRQLLEAHGRLNDAFATQQDVLAKNDLTGRLGRIIARAAATVGAAFAVLVVHPRRGEPEIVVAHGIGEDQARRVAAGLTDGAPTDDRLVVDVASSRHLHGRLGVFFNGGRSGGAGGELPGGSGSSAALAFYAEAAAAALDLASPPEARDTAEAMLRFARSLGGLGTAREVAQHLAEAVIGVVGSDQASVLLWDPLDHRLEVTGHSVRDLSLAHGTSSDSLSSAAGEPSAQAFDRDVMEHSPVTNALMAKRELSVVDATTQDRFSRALLSTHGTKCAALFPLLSDEEFLGFVAAEYLSHGLDPESKAHLRERLEGLADQAVLGLQNASLVEQVGDQAWHDILTGLPNHRLLAERVEQGRVRLGFAEATPALLFIDIDRLNRVNDALGHAAGDELIRQVAYRLREAARAQDTVARLGSDEIGVLVNGPCDRIALLRNAENLLESLHEPFLVAGAEIFTSASIGVATVAGDEWTYPELVSNAAEACRRSKQAGGNTVTIYGDPGSELAETERGHLLSQLREALDRGELFVLYQPFIDLETTQVVGVEALVRWHHPTRGVLEPAAFIVEAEETELIVGIDLFVLREACQQLRRWADEGVTPLRMSVNVAGRDLTHPGFVSSVEMALREFGVPAEWLELEITERVTSDNDGVMRRAADQLRQMGVHFSLDDFGTGSASLQQIAAFPVTTLKVDRSFVQLLGPPDELSSLANAIIELAQKLGLDCVAEGVETSRQSRMLLQRGCSTAQGFFFSPPLLPNDVKRMLQSPMRPTVATPSSPLQSLSAASQPK